MIFIKIEIEKTKKIENKMIFNKKNEKWPKNAKKSSCKKISFFNPKKRIVGVMVIKQRFFKKTSILPCKNRHFCHQNPVLRNGYYHRKKRDWFCVMIFRFSKKSLCKKSPKKHEHTFTHVNHYVSFPNRKNLRKDHVVFYWNNMKKYRKAW